MDIVTKITELKKLLDAGLLSQEEFDKKKSELLEAHIKGQENNEISKEANIPEKTTNEPDEKYPISLDKTKTNSDSSMVSVPQSNKVELNGGNLYSTKKFSKIIACCMLVQCLAGILSINRCSQSKDEDLTSEDSYANTIMEEESADGSTAATLLVEEDTHTSEKISSDDTPKEESVSKEVLGKWVYQDHDFYSDDYAYIDIDISYHSNGSYEGNIQRMGLTAMSADGYPRYEYLVWIKFSGKFTCKTTNSCIEIIPEKSINYGLEYYDEEWLSDENKNEVINKIKNYCSKKISAFRVNGNKELSGFKKEK